MTNENNVLIGEFLAYERFLRKENVEQASKSLNIGNKTFAEIVRGKRTELKPSYLSRISDYLGLDYVQILEIAKAVLEERAAIEKLIGHKIIQDPYYEVGKNHSSTTFNRSFHLDPNIEPLGGNDQITYDREIGIFTINGVNVANILDYALVDKPLTTSTGYHVVRAKTDFERYILAPYEAYLAAKETIQ